MATITHTRGDTLPFVLPLPADATAATLQVHAAGACIEIDGTVIRSRAYFAPAAADILPPGRVYRTTARTTLADGATQTIDSFALLILEGCGDASPAPSGIILSGALVEAGADVASGLARVGISLSGSLREDGSDTTAGTGTVATPTPGSISLSAALIEAGADTASGTASVGITASAALVETGADTAAGTGTVTDPAPQAATLTFASGPDALRIYQRATSTGGQYGKGAADVPVTVTADNPVQSLEYRLRDADQPATTLVDWTAAAGAGAAGQRTLNIAAPARLGDYLLDVRANSDPATVISSPNRFGVGAVILFVGQSQAVRTLGSFPAQPVGGFSAKGIVPSPYGRVHGIYIDGQRNSSARAWAVPADGTSWDSLFLPEFLSREMTRRGVSCAYVGFAEGSTKVSDFKPGTARHAKVAEIITATGGFEGLYWHQGGSDVTGGTTAASYEADLDNILNDLASRNTRAFDMVITAMATRASGSWADVQRIRRAAKAVADRRANAIYAEPRLVALADDVHQTPEGNIALARHTSRHFAAIAAGAKTDGPVLASAVTTGSQLALTFTVASGATLAGAGNWYTRVGVYPAGTTTGRIAATGGAISGNVATLQLASDPGGPVDVYVYDHPDPTGTGAEVNALTDDAGRQAVPNTAAPVVATYQAGTVTPPPPAQTTAPVIVNFYRNTQQTGANNVYLYDVLDVTRTDLVDNTGAVTPIAIHCYHTGNPATGVNGNTTNPAAGINSGGITAGVPNVAGQLFASAVLAESWFLTATPTGIIDITGLVPGAQYEIGVVGSRNVTDTRITEVAVGGQAVSWNATETPPQERKLQVTAASDGTLKLVFRVVSGSLLFAYLSGFSIRRLS